MRISEDEIYEGALKKFGIEKQMIKCIEELSELQKELCKYSLGQGHLENIMEEIADVEIMIGQMKIGLNIGHCELLEMKSQKLHRLNERIALDYSGSLSEEQILEDEAKCRQCRYAVLTDTELDKLDADPCDTGHDLSNWAPKEEGQ